MSELKQGSVTVLLPEGVTLHERAGKLSVLEAAREYKSYANLAQCCEVTAQALEENAGRLVVPGVDVAALRAEAERADALLPIISDLEATLTVLKQDRLLWAAASHRRLLRVRAFLRAHQTIDPRLVELF